MSTAAGNKERKQVTPPSARGGPAHARAVNGEGAPGIETRPHRSPSHRGYVFRRLLAAGDIAALGAAYVAAMVVNELAGRSALSVVELLVFLSVLPLWVVFAHGAGLYHLSERRVDHSFADEIWPVFVTTTVWAWCLVLFRAVVQSSALEILELSVLWFAGICLILVCRGLVCRLVQGRTWYRQPVVVVGDPSDVDRVLRRISRHPECGLDPSGAIRVNPTGFVWEPYPDRDVSAADLKNKAGVAVPVRRISRGETGAPRASDVVDLIRVAGIERVIVTGWPGGLSERTELIRILAGSGICVDLVSGEPEALISTAVLHHLEGLPMLTMQPVGITPLWASLKRAFDLGLAAIASVFLLPVFVYVAVRIKLDSAGPVLFRQQRAGRDGKPFEFLKFRTMVDGAEGMRGGLRKSAGSEGNGDLFKLREDPRVTTFGARLRRRSLDELPQLWNVLRGDMSLVGPRPLPLDEAQMAKDHFAERLKVRPGITGPWQIHGRSDIPFDDMVKLDYTYVAGWRMGEDMRLLVRTIEAVFTQRGAY